MNEFRQACDSELSGTLDGTTAQRVPVCSAASKEEEVESASNHARQAIELVQGIHDPGTAARSAAYR
jgi:hypothetical protein